MSENRKSIFVTAGGKNLAFTFDVNWTHLDQKYSGTVGLVPNVITAKPAAVYELKDQDSIAMILRAQRNW